MNEKSIKKAEDFIVTENAVEYDLLGDVVELAKEKKITYDYERDINWYPETVKSEDDFYDWFESDSTTIDEVYGLVHDITFEAFAELFGHDDGAMHIVYNAPELFESVYDRIIGNGYVEIEYKNLPEFN